MGRGGIACRRLDFESRSGCGGSVDDLSSAVRGCDRLSKGLVFVSFDGKVELLLPIVLSSLLCLISSTLGFTFVVAIMLVI